tara:strand:+ start:754 stop:1041 length:288 start_codon:yes stop_codon:yes gene_type:complete
MRLKKKNDLQSFYANRGNNHKLNLQNHNNFSNKVSSIKSDLILSELKRKSKEFDQRKFKDEVRRFLPVGEYDKTDLIIAHKLALRNMNEYREIQF